jgi:hypothetical protein
VGAFAPHGFFEVAHQHKNTVFVWEIGASEYL